MSDGAGAPARRTPARRTRSKPPAAATYAVEVVRMVLYDVGRSIDLKKAASTLPGVPGMRIARRRDTPDSVTIPAPLCVDLRAGRQNAFCDDAVEGVAASARLYDEGLMSIIVRVRLNSTLEDLHGIETKRLSVGFADMDSYIEGKFKAVMELVRPAISTEHYQVAGAARESYTAFCFADVGSAPADFVAANEAALATLLSGEPWNAPLAPALVKRTLSNPFVYSDNDLAIFDMDRCLIIDAQSDYEDVLLICELANSQFLELRTLDRLLDGWLDEAEDDVRAFYRKRRGQGMRKGTLQRKFAVIQELRLDALFILENLENSAKIIGDYFLGKVYDHLCGIFNTAGWTRSVERRLDALQNVYEIVKVEKNERTMLVLEIVFIVVCVIPIIQFALG